MHCYHLAVLPDLSLLDIGLELALRMTHRETNIIAKLRLLAAVIAHSHDGVTFR
jgi:hypothetical protein